MSRRQTPDQKYEGSEPEPCQCGCGCTFPTIRPVNEDGQRICRSCFVGAHWGRKTTAKPLDSMAAPE